MKKSILLVAIAALTLASCTKEQHTNNNSSQTPISFSSSVLNVETKAPVAQNAAFSAQVIGGTESTFAAMASPATFDKNVAFAAYTYPAFGAGTYSGVVNFPESGSFNFIGFAPAGTRTNKTVALTITGAEDVMVSAKVAADKTTVGGVKLTFQHLLSQLQFNLVAATPDAATAWGNVTNIEVLNQPTKLDLDLDALTLAANATPVNATLTPLTGASIALTTTVSAAPVGTAMILPTSATYSIKVYTANAPLGQTIVIPASILVKGTAYGITLTFKATSILVSANVAAWATGSTTNVEVQ